MLTDMSTIQGYGGAYYVLTVWPQWMTELFSKNTEQSKHGTGELEELPTNLKSYFILVDVKKLLKIETYKRLIGVNK